MAYDYEEQEQLDALKSWWHRYGNLVTALIALVLAGYAAWTGWNYYQRKQAAQASQLYAELQKAVLAKDNAKAQRVSLDMEEKFSKSAYAQMGALVAAKMAFDANDLKTVKTQLQWIIENGRDSEYKALAKIRLAGVLLDEKSYDEALKILADDIPVQFAALVADRKGDIFTSQNKIEEARSAYQSALDKTGKNNPERELIQLKLDAIGGSAKVVG